MNEKLISIIIPVYNGESTIKKCIESAISDKVEIIIVDDGSKDGSLKICQEYEKNNNNINVYHQENKGPAFARKLGIEKSSSKYVMFLDCDDYYEDGIYDRILEVIKKYNSPDIIRFRYRKVSDGYNQYEYFPDPEKIISRKDFKELVYPMFFQGYMLNSLWTNCVKREIFNKIVFLDTEEKLQFGEDLIVNLRIFSNVRNVVFLKDILYNYIYNQDSTTNTKNTDKILKNLEDSIYIYTKLYEYLTEWEMYNKDNVKIINERIKKETHKILEKLN